MTSKRGALLWSIGHGVIMAALHATVAIALAIAFDIAQKRAPWSFTVRDLWLSTALIASYLIGAMIAEAISRRRGRSILRSVLVISSVSFCVLLGATVLAGVAMPPFAVLLIPVFVGGIVGAAIVSTHPAAGAGIVLVVLGSTAVLLRQVQDEAFLFPRHTERRDLETGLYSLRLSSTNERYPQVSTGGGFTLLGSAILVATADGDFRLFREPAFETRAEVFTGGFGFDRSTFVEATSPSESYRYFRVLDVVARPAGGEHEIFVSFHHWDASRGCFVIRVAALRSTVEDLSEQLEAGRWRVIHETSPCAALVASQPGWPFRGMEGGGQLALIDDHHLLLTVGDHGFNSLDFQGVPNLVDDTTSSFGKTVVISLRDSTWRPFTIGHRNQQGLHIDNAGRVWATEHGPRGGDELNLLEDGDRYGWPTVTYGTEYSSKEWPLSRSQGRHEGFRKPMYAWIPSVGISGVTSVQGDLFTNWKGDLLAGSLVGQTLFHVRVEDNRTVFVEPIPIGARIRDILEHPNGRIVLLASDYHLIWLEPETSVFDSCSGCHSLEPGTLRRLGPDLAGVLGRRVASANGFGYSTALRNLGGSWSEEKLDRFLENPSVYVPGTSMAFAGVPDADARSRIIAYLREH